MSSSSGQEAIIQELLDRIQNGYGTIEPLAATSSTVPHRHMARPMDEDELPTFVVTVQQNNEDDAEGESYNPNNGAYPRVMWVWIEARMAAPDDEPDGAPEEHLDPFVDYIHKLLLEDEQLGGLSNCIQAERTLYEAWAGKRNYLAAAMLFRIYYLGSPI